MTQEKDNTVVKLKREKEKNRWSEAVKIFVNGVLVAECEKGKGMFHSVSRSGHPSNIRDTSKRTFSTRWNHGGIRELIGETYDREDFKNDHPDLKWGYQGSCVTNKKVKEIFSKYFTNGNV